MGIRYAVVIGVLAFAAPQQSPTPGWLNNSTNAFTEARKTGKPLFIVFR